MAELTTTPNHLGLILDGNRRWAKAQGLPTLEGHRKGYENLKTIALAAFDRGVSYVSAYVFSTENWNRSKEEVDYLMKLLIWVAKTELNELDKKNVKVRFIGSRERLSKSVLRAVDNAEAKTANNTGGTLLLCLNYGGHQEIVDAVNKIITQKPTHPISVSDFEDYLYAPGLPPVDLIVRTSGEQRLSNFMLWRAAYSELLFVDKHWPAFTEADLDESLENYAIRQRRFGK
jgi:undecaprenyl diphosphate synthase